MTEEEKVEEAVEEQTEEVVEQPEEKPAEPVTENPKKKRSKKKRWTYRERIGECGKKINKAGCQRKKKNNKCPNGECRGSK